MSAEIPTIKVRLQKGDIFKVTENGFYLSDTYLANLLANHTEMVEKLEAEKKAIVAECTINLDAEKERSIIKLQTMTIKLSSCDTAVETQKSIFTKAIDRLGDQSKPKWYESPYFNFVLGAVVFGSVTAAVTYYRTK